ncbi:MAG: PilN domain-containing protein [Hylemonella sp.]|nr:PilN domain-containing protein [Hylemonella sp.]
MAQQINLCTPLFLKQKKYFSATTMWLALWVFLLLGGGLSAYWSWSMRQLGEDYQRSIAANLAEIQALKAAIQTSKENAAPADSTLMQELQASRSALEQRQRWLDDLKSGLVTVDTGHSAHLRLLAQSIPAQAWLTGVKVSGGQVEVSGYVLEPALLRSWVERLTASDLLRDYQLSSMKVEQVAADGRSGAARPVQFASTRRSGDPQTWAYVLVIEKRKPPESGAGDKS